MAFGCSVRECQRRVTASEFNEWIAYYRLEPFGEERADIRMGIMAALTANCHRSRGKAFVPGDFVPEFDAPPRKNSRDMETLFKCFAVAHNEKVKQRG